MHFPDARILIFAKAPQPGRVKTRLIPALGEAGAASLQQHLLEHTLAKVCTADLCPVELWCAPDESQPAFRGLARLHPVSLHRQQGEDLGARMRHAAEEALSRSSSVILIGTDCPVMTPDHLRHAMQRLDEGNAVVIGPAEDGGYVLLGLRTSAPILFEDMPWGTDRVLALTRQRLRLGGIAAVELETLWDIDRPEDWERLRAQRPDLFAQLNPA